ncbi:MAG: hypothetical protein ACRYHQ_20215 [Janthinobacterium lividum]
MITPILRKPHTDAEPAEDNAEARMRQALGNLGTPRPGKPEAPRRATSYQATPGAGRHRFRQDGEVPVVRISLAHGGRSTERQAHVPAGSAGTRPGLAGKGHNQGGGESVRQVQELTEQLRATQTRLGHAELVLREAGREAEARHEEAAGLRQALDTTEAALAQVRATLAISEQAREELERLQEATTCSGLEANSRADTAMRRKVGRPPGSTNRIRDQAPTRKPTPVKWWVEQ